jgi:hypothetical protein
MARKKGSRRKYGKAAGKSVQSAMHREKRGTLRSGKGGKGGKVTSRKQAIAIGLSEARKKGAKVPNWYVRTIETHGRRCKLSRHGRKTAV